MMRCRADPWLHACASGCADALRTGVRFGVLCWLWFGWSASADSVVEILADLDRLAGGVKVSATDRTAALENSCIRYVLNSLDSRPDKVSPIAMVEPISANFYYGGFMRIRYFSASTGTLSPTFGKATTSQSGPGVEARWDLGDERVVVGFEIVPKSEALMLDISGSAKSRTPDDIAVRLLTYPQSFNRGLERANYALCADGEIVAAGRSRSIEEPVRWLYLADARFIGGKGGAAVGVAPDQVRSMNVHVGGYAVMVDLIFAPQDRVQLFLIDFGLRPLARDRELVRQTLDGEHSRFLEWLGEK